MVFRKPNLTKRTIAKGNIVANFLNVTAAVPKKQKKVLELIMCSQELTELLPRILQGKPAGSVVGSTMLYYDLAKNVGAAQLLKKINRILGGYPFRRAVPSSVFVSDDEPPALWTHHVSLRLLPFSEKERQSNIDESGAVELVLDLAEIGAIDRIRQCPNCKQWFMAHRSDQQFCRGECSRENYYSRNKNKWAKYQKDYRERERDRIEYQEKRRNYGKG